jgi:hypothetical protein
MINRPIVFAVRGKVVPKERPNVSRSKVSAAAKLLDPDAKGKSHSYYSEGYSNWQADAKIALMAAVGSMPASITRYFPLSGVLIEIEFHGCIRGNADLSNCGGSWEDALVRAGVIVDDNRQMVNQVNFKYFECEHPISIVTIHPGWVPKSTADPRLLIPPIPSTGKKPATTKGKPRSRTVKKATTTTKKR